MTTAKDTCPGCSREFASRGFLNHLRLSHDPRCASAWDRLQPTYPGTLDQEPPPPSPTIDVEMVDLSNVVSTIPRERSDQTTTTDIDTDMSGDNGIHGGRPRLTFEEAPESSIQAPVVFESDTEDSDDEDDGNQDRTPHSEPEMLSSSTNAIDTGAGQMPQTGGFAHIAWVSHSDRNLLAHPSQPSQAPSNPVTARFVVKFAGAGEVLETQPSLAGYQQYASCLGIEENGPTEWALFSTRREWEVARWAKLRGPSSTALSELLEIDGVSWSILICSARTKRHSSASRSARTVIFEFGGT